MNFIYKYMYEDYNRNTLGKLHLNKSNDLLVMALNETDWQSLVMVKQLSRSCR